jgi:hypothetical protein
MVAVAGYALRLVAARRPLRLQSALKKAFEHTTRPCLIVVEPARSGEAEFGQTA